MMILFCSAQDSIPGEIFQDSLPADYPEQDVVDFLAEGYYDHVPSFTNIPKVDTAEFGKLTAAYKTEEFDYDKENVDRVSLFKRIFERINRWLSQLFPDTNNFQFSDLFYKILAVFGIIVLIWILYRVLISRKRWLKPNDEKDEDLDEIRFVEKNLLDLDLSSYIDQARKDGDFVRAIRYLNLLNIQLLAKKGMIDWRYTKSHMELIDELQDNQLKKEFAGNVDILNRVWYGGMPVDEKKYDEFSHYFLNFQAKWQ
ncbi:hypothetical protein [Sphingobacterium deserti]|nr:hypothetical protein [Sphingobacterium deserti]